MTSMENPMSGEHHDLHHIEDSLENILFLLQQIEIENKGLFLNADDGLDSKKCRVFLENND
ncbi:hypothetical protein D1631_05555 [Chryseobacterium nematophagum]|uniref:Uncharacterized protein n=1 Tax=Chryseobacterium nematophagum TaxID=2305228 RepID=A0A3M7TD64_9FLAO|nr:hypothetical protein [Chryseobacterium nematophagum]RNA61435.1 hypothetical protein D1631_05555 [Chryseobacterium nematophagum]